MRASPSAVKGGRERGRRAQRRRCSQRSFPALPSWPSGSASSLGWPLTSGPCCGRRLCQRRRQFWTGAYTGSERINHMGEITCIFLRATRNATYGKTQSIFNKYCFGLLDHRRCYLSNTSFSFSFVEKKLFFSISPYGNVLAFLPSLLSLEL